MYIYDHYSIIHGCHAMESVQVPAAESWIKAVLCAQKNTVVSDASQTRIDTCHTLLSSVESILKYGVPNQARHGGACL